MNAKHFKLVGEGNYDHQTARQIDLVNCGERVTSEWMQKRTELARRMEATQCREDRKAYWQHCNGVGSVHEIN